MCLERKNHIGNTDNVEDFFWHDEHISLLEKKDDSKVLIEKVYWNEQGNLYTVPQEKEKTPWFIQPNIMFLLLEGKTGKAKGLFTFRENTVTNGPMV